MNTDAMQASLRLACSLRLFQREQIIEKVSRSPLLHIRQPVHQLLKLLDAARLLG